MYRQGAPGPARRQMVKKGTPAAGMPSAAGAWGRIRPMVIPRSPLEATITDSGAQKTGLVVPGLPVPIEAPIAAAPTR
jgi:hypothetical protein